ncbi:MAG TPA: BACON domain-containing carbohydrate-binding protein, partial [Candidatus Acidoferrum sp.]|nr:BACON domain-containing carbohydrate-binding protein [Candidatus Acidoferrum sp.]
MTKRLNVLLRTGVLLSGVLLTGLGHAADRVVRGQDMAVTRGGTNQLFISFETLGDEYAVGFSLCFDTNQLAFVGAVRGSSVSNTVPLPAFTTNFTRATNGEISIFIPLNITTRQTWPPGTQSIAEVRFRALPGNGPASTTVSFCSVPTPKEVSSTNGAGLATAFINSTVTINGPCSYALNTNEISFTDVGGSDLVNVTTGPNCVWGVTNTNSWIIIAPDAGGTGNGTMMYDVEANPSTSSRTGVVVIAGQALTITQLGFVCSYLLFSTDATHDYIVEENTIDLLTQDGCEWDVTTTNTWITILSLTNNTGSGTFTYGVTNNDTGLMRTGTVMAAGQPVTVVQFGAPCIFNVTPSSATHGAGIGSGQVTVAVPQGCEWEIVNTHDWISFPSTTYSTGATVTYTLAANSSTVGRTGLVLVADQNIEVIQAGIQCFFTLSVSNLTHTSAAITNSIGVTTANDCTWDVATTNDDWITIQSSAANTGNGPVTYALSENSSLTQRIGFISIASETLVITQQALVCMWDITETSRQHSPAAQSASVNVTAQSMCPWFVEEIIPWITITAGASGSGNGIVSYDVDANPGTNSRTAMMTIAGKNFTVTQLGFVCNYLLFSTAATHDYSADTNTIGLLADDGCEWEVTTTDSWITIHAPANKIGSGAFTYTVSGNTGMMRTGTVLAANQPVTIVQSAGPCAFVLSDSNRTHTAAPITNSISVTTRPDCTWNVATTNIDWITIPPSPAHTGNGPVTYALSENSSLTERIGFISIASETLVITQQALVCAWQIDVNSRDHAAAGQSASVNVTAQSICSWSVENIPPWITITAGASGTGNGTVSYDVEANVSTVGRMGVMVIAGQPFTVTQLPLSCNYLLFTTDATHDYPGATNSIGMLADDGCEWEVATTNTWIRILSPTNNTGSGTFTYGVTNNDTGLMRTGTVMAAGQPVTIVQFGAPCIFNVSPPSATHGAGIGSGQVTVAAPQGCEWEIVNPYDWISFPNTSYSAGATVTYTLGANSSTVGRTGMVLVAGQNIEVIQAGVQCFFTLSDSNRTHTSVAITNSIGVTTANDCTWDVATTNNDWITIQSAAANTGNGTVTYALSANSSL